LLFSAVEVHNPGMDESENTRREWRDSEEARRRLADLLGSGKATPEPSPAEKLEQEAKRKREAMAAAAEARHDKSHMPAAGFFGVATGAVGTGIVAVLVSQAKNGCIQPLFGPPKTDTWCLYVNAMQRNDLTYLFIAAVLGAIGYGAVYLYFYFLEN
jgi:hypothetical protein